METNYTVETTPVVGVRVTAFVTEQELEKVCEQLSEHLSYTKKLGPLTVKELLNNGPLLDHIMFFVSRSLGCLHDEDMLYDMSNNGTFDDWEPLREGYDPDEEDEEEEDEGDED